MKEYVYTLGYNNRYGNVIYKIDIANYAVSEIYGLYGSLMEICNISYNHCSLPNISEYTFDSLKEAIDFTSKKINPCPVKGEFYGYKKAFLMKEKELVMTFGDFGEPLSCGNYMQVVGRCIVTLLISAKVARTGCYYEKKCRASRAKTVKIEKICADGTLSEVGNEYFARSIYCENYRDYVLGKTTYADSFDDNKKLACSNGIHFFLKKEEALAYMGG